MRRRFWIDAGNGHVTLLPSVLFAVGMTWDLVPPRLLGLVSFVYFWQMFYGESARGRRALIIARAQGVLQSRGVWAPTCVAPAGTVLYFSSYFHNERYKGRPGFWIVMCANSLWMVFPAWGMRVCYDIVTTDSLRLVRS